MPVATKPKPAAKKATATKAPAKKATTTKTTKAAPAKAAPATPTYKAIDVAAIVKRLKAGETMTTIRSEYGAGPKIRKALTEAGYNTKGEKIEKETISTVGGAKATAKRIAAARADGWPWYRIELATGMTEGELRTMLTEQGHEALVTGRQSTATEDKPAAKAATKKAPAKATAAKAKPAATTKAKAAPTAAAKPKPRRVGAKRPQADA